MKDVIKKFKEISESCDIETPRILHLIYRIEDLLEISDKIKGNDLIAGVSDEFNNIHSALLKYAIKRGMTAKQIKSKKSIIHMRLAPVLITPSKPAVKVSLPQIFILFAFHWPPIPKYAYF